MTKFVKGFEFDFLAQRPLYTTCPLWLIEQCKVHERSRVVDLGCGSGLLAQSLLERFHYSPDLRVFCIDPSEWELNIARTRIQDPRVTFIQGCAQTVHQIVDDKIDSVLLCNVLHQIPIEERASVLKGAFRIVRAGGMVGANTLFYHGGIESITKEFYLRWMMETRQVLHRESVKWKMPTRKPIALQLLSPTQHYELLVALGFESIVVEEIPFDWGMEDWQALSRYSIFIQGALFEDVDLELGSRALMEGVKLAYQALGLSTVRRSWLHFAARKPEG